MSLLHLGGMPWARIAERVGHNDLVTTARTYTHVVTDEAELDYGQLVPAERTMLVGGAAGWRCRVSRAHRDIGSCVS